ncbi:MAG: DUF3761 domain-containing protein [Bacteroidales bacterium]|nr:DUF3761 domain-containing protein [Candidatus Colimorpha onthohippi]
MKKYLSIVVLLLPLLLGNIEAKTKYTTANLNIRVEPTVYSPVLSVIPRGTTIEIEDDCDCAWVPVYYNGTIGYVCTRYISDSAPRNVARPTSSVRYYTNSYGRRVQSPTRYSSAPAGATALCRDGSYSFSQSRRGTCSHHGGVARWF